MRRLVVVLGALAVVGSAVAGRWLRDDDTRRAAIGPSTIVLLGDSLTEGGDWDRLLPGREVSNQGYPGATTAELVEVAAEVASHRPATVLVLTGTNDIRDGHPPEWSGRQLERLLDRLEQGSPDTRIVVQTVLPRADAPGEVTALNETVTAVAAARGHAVLDLHATFDDGRGGLRPDETTDGIHLAEPGYRRWADELVAHFADAAG